MDVGGGVPGDEPADDEQGELVPHAGRDVAEGGGEEREGADEGAGFFERVIGLGCIDLIDQSLDDGSSRCRGTFCCERTARHMPSPTR
ncbi:hypothetical protein [Streptomyces gardneri]|uniref:hypothetical protein n=1 Tax=Streptomyces gardneri TaxID=66892 RepID=UPI0036C2C731